MKSALRIGLMITCLAVAALSAANDQYPQRPSTSSGYGDMGPGMMSPGSGYQGHGPGMMQYDGGMRHGMRGRGHMMGPDQQGWQELSPEQREQWRRIRARFMLETLPLRQELSAKQLELETLWDQKNPDSEKVKVISDRITELRAALDRKYDAYLAQCREEFGDRGWTCPGSGWR